MSERCHDEILGIPFDTRSQGELERIIAGYLCGTTFRRIATVNPEFLVLAKNDPDFARCLMSADIRIVDGSGIVLVGLLSGFGVSRYPGADLMTFLLSIAEREEVPVYLAVNRDGLSSYVDVHDSLRRIFPNLILSGCDLLGTEAAIPDDIREAGLVLCNFGAPRQEYFLESLRHTPGSIRLAMGVGGSFDFLTGKRSRAPRLIRAMGLEWLFRLVTQPKRFVRIWNAVVIFPFLCLSDRMRGGKQ
ncbi:MAG TPA: WecB/TagA/CpsF family glycosyltransferase [Candidatus Fimivivens sp.]|nr:WecB/TagA/CpsF family glycosyltransferase [Candidatus Fimivivens sp.]